MKHLRLICSVFVLACILFLLPLSGSTSPTAPDDPLLTIMQSELQRAHTQLSKADPAPYFISYSVVDRETAIVIGMQGALVNSTQLHRRGADVVVRVGSNVLDNTHGKGRYSAMTSGELPLQNDSDAVSRVLWRLTDREYRRSAEAFLKVKTDAEVRAKEEDTSGDFSNQKKEEIKDESSSAVNFDRKVWEETVRRISAEFRKYPEILSGVVMLQADKMRTYFASSEGTETVQPSGIVRLMVQAETQADDGMQLLRVESFQASGPEKLPSFETIAAKIATMAADLKRLREAKVAEPYSGPALLSGRSSAVLFHEVLGHRLEGQRQRGDEEGQTFTKKVNEQVLPQFLSVVDDPTLKELNGTELSGWYKADEEGQPAQRVALIENGVLKSFLMSRMPVRGFAQSNGHGRAQPGFLPTGRQGNLIVESSQKESEDDLRKQFIAEIKKQGKPYGLYFEDIEGGFTLTTRQLPQAFQVLPVMVWRVYPDGRPDELVRGVNIVGTPIAAMGHIIATGDKQHIFNGICGAESGNIPVSAVAPAMLFSEIEVQRKDQGHDRPPILPPPPLDTRGGGQ